MSILDSPPLLFAFSLDQRSLTWIIIGSIAIVAILASTITKAYTTRQREQTRRELAAYVAEGTIDPDKAIALMKAGRSYEEALADAPWMQPKPPKTPAKA